MLGAGETIEVDEIDSKGKNKKNKYRLRPVRAKHLMDLERDALTSYKHEYLKTFSENAHLFPQDRRDEILIREMTKVAGWDLSNLPQKTTYSVIGLVVTSELKKEMETRYNQTIESDNGVLALVSNALETGTISEEDVLKLTKTRPLKAKVRYDQWWVTASIEGMVSFVTNSVRHDHPELTSEMIQNWPFAKIVEAAQIVERLTTASLGNG